MKYLKNRLLLLILIGLTLGTFAQHQITPEWIVHSTGENTWNRVTDQITDIHGNIYLCGNFKLEFGVSNDNKQLNGANGIFVMKTTSGGIVLWIKKIEATGHCDANSLAAGPDGHIFLCGNFRGDLQQEGFSISSPRRKNAFILKMDETGSPVWLKKFDGKFTTGLITLIPDTDGEIFLAGSFTGIADLEGHGFNSGFFADIIVVRLDRKGEITGLKHLSGVSDDIVFSIIATSEEEIILTGAFEKELMIDGTSLSSIGMKDIFMVKLNRELKLLDAVNHGGPYDDAGRVLCADHQGNILLAGIYGGEIQFGKSIDLEPYGRSDVFLAKFNSNFQPTWAAGFGGLGSDFVNSMDINTYGDTYLTGNYYGRLDVEMVDREAGDHSSQVFLAKYDANGNFKYFKSLGDLQHDFARTISVGLHNDLLVSGNYSDKFNLLGEKTRNLPGESMFFSLLHECGLLPGLGIPADTVVCGFEAEIQAREGFELYLWNGQAGGSAQTVDSTGWYIVEAIDSYGCTYTDTMFVTINPPREADLGDTLYVRHGDPLVLTALEGMESYKWSDGSNLPVLSINTREFEPGSYVYWVKVVDEDGCVGHDEVVVRVLDEKAMIEGLTRVDSFQDQFEVNVYPNPLKQSEELVIQFSEEEYGNVLLQIYSPLGKLIIHKEFEVTNNNRKVFDIADQLSPGTHILLLIVNKQIFHKKLVIL